MSGDEITPGNPIRSTSDRFWAKVDQSGECWTWSAYVTADGYGKFNVAKGLAAQAHRFAYELLVGPIPAGLVIDHLCRNRACVNPAHLEPVTDRENRERGARSPLAANCVNGHPRTPDNTYEYKGHRGCRTCRRAQARAYAARRAAA